MQKTMTQRPPLPPAIAIEAEAARIEKMIAAVSKKIEASDCNLRTFMQLQLCRAELQTYCAGLLYALGHTSLLDMQQVETHLAPLSIPTVGSVAEDLETYPRLVQCFEC